MATFQPLKGARILILFPHMVTPGGALNYTLRLADVLAKQRAQVAILSLKTERNSLAIPPGVEILSLNGPLTSSLRYWLLFPVWQAKLNRTIAAWQPDILISQVFPSNWWGWLYKRRHPDIKMIWVSHEPSAFIHSPELIDGLRPFWKKWLAKLLQPVLRPIDLSLAEHGDCIIANSHYTAEQIERVYSKKSSGIACPGIDLDQFFPDDTPREYALITVAHLVPYKRIDFLLRVFAQLKERHRNLVFHIVGEGPTAGELQNLAHELGIGESVFFQGKLTHAELAALLRRMTLFVFAGVKETFGMAPLEAIASGTPVVAHKSGGPTEFVTRECGLLIDSLRTEDWVMGISSYLEILEAQGFYPEQIRQCALKYDWSSSLRPAIEIIVRLFAQQLQRPLPNNHGKKYGFEA